MFNKGRPLRPKANPCKGLRAMLRFRFSANMEAQRPDFHVSGRPLRIFWMPFGAYVAKNVPFSRGTLNRPVQELDHRMRGKGCTQIKEM